MKVVGRFKPIFSVSNRRLGLVFFSSPSTSSKLKARDTPLKSQAEASGFTSLFREITDILGDDVITSNETLFRFPHPGETHVKENVSREELDSCKQDVRENADVSSQVGIDVSPVVHEITSVIRADDDVVSLENRLENIDFAYESEIVEKVLKRCFKVPHLALRFYNWVKNKNGFSHTTETYNAVLCIAGEARELSLVDEIMNEMDRNSCKKNIKTWTSLISVYGKAKQIGRALSAFENMQKCGYEPDTAAYKIMIKSLCIARRGDIAIEFYREMIAKDMSLDLKSYKMLLDCVTRLENLDIVQSIADDMVRTCEISKQEAYGYLLKSLCVARKIQEALELIREMKNKEVSLSANLFEILVKGLCRAKRIDDALEIVDIMNRKNLIDSNIYGIIISGYLEENDISKALELFEFMKTSGHLPRVSTYTQIMQHLFKAKQYQKGYDLFNEMIRNGIEPDIVAITAVVAGNVRQNRIAEAWKMFDSINPTWKSYSIFAKELCRTSKHDEILKLLNQMQAKKIDIGDDLFSWVIVCMEKNGENEKLEKVKEMQGRCKLDSREREAEKEMIRISELNHPEPAKKLPEASLTVNETDVQEVLRILLSSSEWEKTKEALENSRIEFKPELVVEVLHRGKIHGNSVLRFFSWVGKTNGYEHTTETYNMGIKVAGTAKDFKNMRNLFYEMRRNRCLITQDTWAIMIMQYGKAGLTDIALRTFKEMKDGGFIPKASTFTCLITVLCQKKHRKAEEAIKAFREMISSGFVPDKRLVEEYLKCLCEIGNKTEAMRCLESLGKIGFSITVAYSTYIRALCRVGNLDEALSVLDEFNGDRSVLEQYTYGSIVHGLLQRGQLQEAMTKLDSMKRIGIDPGIHVYTSLIVYFFKEKQWEKALEIFEKMEEERCKLSVVTYTAMICGYMSMGKEEEAWNLFNDMKKNGPLPDFTTYTKFINCLCQAKRSEDSMSLLSEMLEKGIAPSTINFRTVFFGLNREGKRQLAQDVIRMKSALSAQRKVSI